MFIRRLARPSSSSSMMMMCAKINETTIAPEVIPNAREVLIGLYGKTLNDIQRVPEDEGYRKSIQSLTRQRLSVCEEEQDFENIGKRLGVGQVEELIEEAKDELKVIDKMLEWDPWGVNDDYVSAEVENGFPVPKHVPGPPGPLPEDFFKALKAAANVKSGEDD